MARPREPAADALFRVCGLRVLGLRSSEFKSLGLMSFGNN